MPEQTATANVALGASQHLDTAMDVPYDWWTLYRSPYLDQLVQQAFQHNPSIEAAQAALGQAQEFANAQQGILPHRDRELQPHSQ